jgi:hypothetical protein
MIGQLPTSSTPRHKPAAPMRRLRNTLVVAAILVGTGAVGTTAGIARTTAQPQPTPQTSEYVLPSEQVMREMRAVIIALYGPRPAAAKPDEPQCSSPRGPSRNGASRPHAG